MLIVTLAMAALCAVSERAQAQTPPPAVEVTAGVERLRYDYRFENDSSFDTPFLVPHFFEQRYERTGTMLGIAARYRFLGRDMRTALAWSPEVTAFGSDFDTFFQPDGDVAASGTAGDVTLGSLGVEHSIALGAGRGAVLAAVFTWRRDRADFLPADRVVTHTHPPSETRELTTDRETTTSQVFEVGLEGRWAWIPRDSRWKVEMTGRAVPALRARLLVQLPDKYPDRDIVFSAAGWSARAGITASRRVGAVRAGITAGYDRAGSYRDAARFSRGAMSAAVVIAFESRR